MQRIRAIRKGDATYYLNYLLPIDDIGGGGGGSLYPVAPITPITQDTPIAPVVPISSSLPPIQTTAPTTTTTLPTTTTTESPTTLLSCEELAAKKDSSAFYRMAYNLRGCATQTATTPALTEGQAVPTTSTESQVIPTVTTPVGNAIPVVNVGPNSAFSPTGNPGGSGGGGSAAAATQAKADPKKEWWKWALVAAGLAVCFFQTRNSSIKIPT